MQTLPTDADAVVIGGGLAGLTAATLLGRSGLRVTLLERASDLGGRAATRLRSGFSFNLGPHALYSGGAASRTLADLGVRFTAHAPSAPLLLRSGHLHRLSALAHPLALARGEFLNLAETLELTRFILGVARLDARSVAAQSVETFVAGRVHLPRVRQVVCAFARTFVYSSALDLVSAEVFADKLRRSLRHPVLYLDGGWGVLVDGLRRAAEGAGVRVLTGSGVEQVMVERGGVEGVRLRGGGRVHTRCVVVATPPKAARALLDGAAGAALERAVAPLQSVQVACLDVALSRLPAPGHGPVQDLEQPRFASPQSRFARIAPKGAGFVTTFKALDPRVPTDPDMDERDLEALLDAAQPGWRTLVLERVFLPRIEAVGALPSAAMGGFAGRPGVEAAGVPGLYLAGDWVGPEGFLVDAAFASARDAAVRLLRAHPQRSEGVPWPVPV